MTAAIAAMVTGCSTLPDPGESVTIQRTAHGIAHIEATDYEHLAYGIAYAHAEDNVCQTANHILTVRGERSRWFGGDEQSLLGLRILPNEQIDIFIRSHMDDAALSLAQQSVSSEAQAMARGYVAGYNRYLRDHEGRLPAPCGGQQWVHPMTIADYLRMQELTMVQLGVALMADAVVEARPPVKGEVPVDPPPVEEAVAALARFQLNHPGLGSNGWAFGGEVTDNGHGVLLGNPHFPWTGVNRFWQMHLTIPGELDVMGAAIDHSPVVQVGFNNDVAWTHTVSTGTRFTIHELELVSGEPTQYMLDGRKVAMVPQTISYRLPDGNGGLITQEHTVWSTRFGPVIEVRDAGLSWNDAHAYALQDANTLNLRAIDIWVGFDRAQDVEDMRATLSRLGVPWVNTIAADRNGEVMYADVSVVPDIDDLQGCAPSPPAAALFAAAGLVVLDGSRTECNWRGDPESPVPGLVPIERMPVAVRRDWVQNSNDSFWLSNPAIDWREFSPLIGAVDEQQSLRTRAGLYEIRKRLAGDGTAAHEGIGIHDVQAMLFANHNHAAHLVLDDFLAVCDQATTTASRDGCAVLSAWDRSDNLDARGAHLFREWWRKASKIENVWRVPFDPARPLATPSGLDTDDPEIRARLFTLLDDAVVTVQAAGFALDAPLGKVQFGPAEAPIGLHGGMEFEGILNKVESLGTDTLPSDGYQINFGTSYVQTVTFDDDGPVAEALMTYGQSSQPGSPWSFDQLPLYAAKDWQKLPFHREDIARGRIGSMLRLTPEN